MKPIYIGHSFGGSQVFYSATKHPDRMRGALLLDTGFGGPPTKEQEEQWRREAEKSGDARWRGPMQRTRPNRVYATLEEALTRFRFMPPQAPGNLFVADYIARTSLKRAPMADGSGQGWTWKFDPFLWGKLDRKRFRAARSGQGAADRADLRRSLGDHAPPRNGRTQRLCAGQRAFGRDPGFRAPHHGRPAARPGSGPAYFARSLAGLSLAAASCSTRPNRAAPIRALKEPTRR